jgi:hypothetical protein
MWHLPVRVGLMLSSEEPLHNGDKNEYGNEEPSVHGFTSFVPGAPAAANPTSGGGESPESAS